MRRTLFRALIGIIFIPSLSLIKPANSNPYNQYYPYQNRNDYQRSSWSDGDFFEHLQVEEDKVVMTTIQDHQIISLG